MATPAQPQSELSWSLVPTVLAGMEFERLLYHHYSSGGQDSHLYIAVHKQLKLLVVAQAHGKEDPSLVAEMGLYGVVRFRAFVTMPDAFTALDDAHVIGPTQRLPLTISFQCFDPKRFSPLILALSAVGEFVNWGITLGPLAIPLVQTVATNVDSVAGEGCFEAWSREWPDWVQTFLTQAPV